MPVVAEITKDLGAPFVAALAADDQCSSSRLSGDDAGDGCALGLMQIRAQRAQEAARPKKTKEHAQAPELLKTDPDQPAGHGQTILWQEAQLSKSAEEKFMIENSYEAQMAKFKDASSYEHPAWLKNCTDIYFVLGANIGVGIRKAFETEKYADSPLLPILDNVFGDGDKRRALWKDSGFCALGFEPNPRHAARHASIKKAYQERGWHVHVYQYAAWHTEGVMAFNSTGKRLRVLGDAASGDKTSQGAHLSLRYKGIPGNDGIAVRTVDFAQFLPKMLGHAAVGASIKLLSMDIEGAEYETLAQMMRMNTLCKGIIGKALISAHKYGDIEHWRGGRNHTRSFHEIEWRMQQLSAAKLCGGAGGVTSVAAFADDTYAQDLDEHFGSHYDRRMQTQEQSYAYYSAASDATSHQKQQARALRQQHRTPKAKAPKKEAQSPRSLDALLHGP